MAVRLVSTEIKQVQRASGREHAPNLAQRFLPLLRLKMVEHEGGEHSIKRRVGIRQLVRKSLVELDGDGRSFRLSPGPGKRPRIGIESNNGYRWIAPFDQRSQCACAAANIEHAMRGLESRLIQERLPCLLAAQQ